MGGTHTSDASAGVGGDVDVHVDDVLKQWDIDRCGIGNEGSELDERDDDVK